MKTSEDPQKATANPECVGGAVNQPSFIRDGKTQVYTVMFYYHFGLVKNIKHCAI